MQGRALIRSKGLSDIARFEKGDAFDGDDLAALDPAPTLAIVSGLYELFGDNAMVARSLGGLSRAVRPGGYLVYTGQPLAPAAGIHRARAHQPPCRLRVGDAALLAGGDG
ncbi:class I SAM-dependent methyltransferase family protein [Cupriavidus basilensis]